MVQATIPQAVEAVGIFSDDEDVFQQAGHDRAHFLFRINTVCHPALCSFRYSHELSIVIGSNPFRRDQRNLALPGLSELIQNGIGKISIPNKNRLKVGAQGPFHRPLKP